ncbi:hypothetical protein PG985_008509 [Apiospora marii]|uniref:Uncharacterized protein n=1 Tax=Apiospora marii TaxID=335849 RepID=A0ABR1SSI1_9PEZI
MSGTRYMSRSRSKSDRSRKVPWDADMHEQLLVGVIKYFKPTMDQYRGITEIMEQRGHDYSADCLRCLFYLIDIDSRRLQPATAAFTTYAVQRTCICPTLSVAIQDVLYKQLGTAQSMEQHSSCNLLTPQALSISFKKQLRFFC